MIMSKNNNNLQKVVMSEIENRGRVEAIRNPIAKKYQFSKHIVFLKVNLTMFLIRVYGSYLVYIDG